MSRVPAPANANQVVLDATQVEQRVDIVHPRPRSGPLVRHRVRNPVLLPPQPRQWIIPLHTPSHVPPRVSRSSHLSIRVPQSVHPSQQKLATTYKSQQTPLGHSTKPQKKTSDHTT
ncbi:hypothetical protein M758_8G072400 [Ceratodon purpureus]|nr:hypothetical protein M758_8G072400 [Ceratodon purpureus]